MCEQIVRTSDTGIIVLPVSDNKSIIDRDTVLAKGAVIGQQGSSRVRCSVKRHRELCRQGLNSRIDPYCSALRIIGCLPVIVLGDSKFGYLVQDLGTGNQEDQERKAG